VFLDEPTTGLDPETRRQIWNIIQAEKAMGRCMIITTHSMEEVREGVRLEGGGLRRYLVGSSSVPYASQGSFAVPTEEAG
jgi:ABC-type transport system involved in cytochrome bd biosynthesis fused ATPase/permease subunit